MRRRNFAAELSRLGSDRGGAALVEFAIIAPLLVLLYIGTVESTSAVRAYLKLNAAAQAYADLIANQAPNPGITTTSLANYCAGAKLVLFPLDTSKLSIAAASLSNSGTPAQDWHDTVSCGTAVSSIAGLTLDPCPGSSCLVPNSGDSAIIVKASYSYTSFLHYVLPLTQTFTQVASARPRQNAKIPCSNCAAN
jgi:Flp pilus assembly protein TadG